MLSFRTTTRAVFAAVVLSTATAASASAADPDTLDQWQRWATKPGLSREAWIRSLDYIGPALFAGAEGEGVFSSPTAPGPYVDQNTGLEGIPGAKAVHQVSVSPDGQVYAATSAGLFRSPAGQGGWQQVGGGEGTRKLNMGGIQSIKFNGPTGTDITVAVAGAAGAGVYNTIDGGAHWDRASGMNMPENVYYLTTGPAQFPMYAAADAGVYQSLDFGRSWILTSDGIPAGETTLRVAVSPTNPKDLYASTSSSVYYSSTGGLSWKEAAGSDGQTLPSGGKRAFLLTPNISSGGKNLFGASRALVGTTSGVYGTLDNGQHWKPMSGSTIFPDGSLKMEDRIVWALNIGIGSPVITAGTQGFGVYNILPQPLSGGSPTLATAGALKQGTQISISNLKEKEANPADRRFMGFQGMKPYFFDLQWHRCDGPNTTDCDPITGAKGETYTVPKTDADDTLNRAEFRYRVRVIARNLVSPDPITVWSPATAKGVSGNGDDVPYVDSPLPSLTAITNPGPVGQPSYDSEVSVNSGHWRTKTLDNPPIPASGYRYRWDRCNEQNTVCTTLPAATEKKYKITKADIGYRIAGYVQAVYNTVSGDWRLAGTTNLVLNRIPANLVKPKVVGDMWVGRAVSGSVGAWNGHALSFNRRWLRCNEEGLQCNPLNPNQTGPTLQLTAADKGYRFRLEVEAVGDDPVFDRKFKLESDASPVVTDPPPPPADPADPNQGGGQQGQQQQQGGGGQQGGGQQQPVKQLVEIKLPKKLKVGATLQVPKSVSGYKKLKYQWLRNGKKIKKATKRSYKVTKADRGKKISCKITLTPAAGGKAKDFTTLPVAVPKK